MVDFLKTTRAIIIQTVVEEPLRESCEVLSRFGDVGETSSDNKVKCRNIRRKTKQRMAKFCLAEAPLLRPRCVVECP